MSLPSINPRFDAFAAALTPEQAQSLDAAWADILRHGDISGRNADYARRARLLHAAAELGYTP